MKKLLPRIIFLAALVACQSSQDNGQEATPGGNKNDPEVSSFTDYKPVIDSLSRVKNELEDELESLKQKFAFKKQDLNGRSYYHKNWWGKYFISDETILAGVDSLGNFFLIANVWHYSYLDLKLDSIRIRVDTASFYAASDSSYILDGSLMVVCACGFHQACFTDSTAQTIGKMIAENPQKDIRWVGVSKPGQRDITGIKESFELSEKLQRIFDIEDHIKELNQQQQKRNGTDQPSH